MNAYRLIAVCAFSLILYACAPSLKLPELEREDIEKEAELQRNLALDLRFEEQKKLLNVGHKILQTGAPLCRDVSNSVGLFVWNAHFYDFKPYRSDIARLYNLDRDIYVFHAVAGSPAEGAGIKAGARIVSVNGHQMEPGPKASEQFAKALNDPLNNETAQITYVQDDKVYETELPFDPVCDYRLIYEHENMEVNAYAAQTKAGKPRIIVTRGMMQFTNESELAGIMAHELAHHLLDHLDKGAMNIYAGRAVGAVLDWTEALIFLEKPDNDMRDYLGDKARRIYSQSFEAEADYLGLYIYFNAGYQIQDYASFWRRMASEISISYIDHAVTHPAGPERTLLIGKVEEEIKRAVAKGNKKPIWPNLASKVWSRAQLRYMHEGSHGNP